MSTRFIACVCTSCNERHGTEVFPDHLCHHCGKPLCAKDTIVVQQDLAFSIHQDTPTAAAAHCKKCAWTFHRRRRPANAR